MILFLIDQSLAGQGRKGLELLYYPGGRALLPSLSAKLSYQAGNGNYFELRQNYEEDGTIACSAGKSFSGTAPFTWVVTPVAGLVAGTAQGLSMGLNAQGEYKGISLSTSIQHTSCFLRDETGFLFSWSELGYAVTDHLTAGLAMQHTGFHGGASTWEPGGMIAFSLGQWSFPLYLFKSGDRSCSVAAGICYQ